MSRAISYKDLEEKYKLLLTYVHKSTRIIMFTHQNADPDALCAAYSMHWLIRKLNRKAEVQVVSPEGISEQSRTILSKVKMELKESIDSEPVDLIFMIDTSSMWTLGSVKDLVEVMARDNPLVLVDHHHPNEGISKYSPLAFIDEEATSTCEVVFNLFKDLKVIPSKKVSQVLLTGVMFDTRHFIIGKVETFELAAELCRLGASPSTSARWLHTVTSLSERVARLKAAQRCKIYRIKDWIMAVSNLSSYQASGARALISLGADLAIVVGSKKGILRVNLRATEQFVESTGIHLGKDLSSSVGNAFNGAGGGHSTAAGAITKAGTAEEISDHILRRISSLLGAPLKEIK